MTTFKLISFKLCPYVQRAAIVLAEKGVPFERVDIDLANKPDWFLKLSPLGKVPVLVVTEDDGREEVLFESAVIAEYLDEVLAPRLHPADPLTKARHRAWIEFASATLADIAGFYAGDAATFEAKRIALAEKFARLEAELGDGPWFGGERFGLVDAAFAPVFRYFDLFDRVADHGVLTGKPKLAAWRAALAARPSVAGAVAADYPEALAAFIVRRDGHLGRLIQPALAA
ncbi:glutathione S-transferase family protein [Allosphingosinicella sp.]|uniref:glutathione S-transferase family protein n=1 Tax=Allosphingosinicella sp. TaxID=2823234 RepID=UPI00378517DD